MKKTSHLLLVAMLMASLAQAATDAAFCLESLAVEEPPTPPEFATRPSIHYESLRKGFVDIPDEAKMRAWWFWHEGQATRPSITQDLEAMKSHGIGGAILCDNGGAYTPPGPVFMSDEWKALFTHVIRESTRLGIEISANLQSGCGDPGNPNIADDNGLKRIVFSETKVTGPASIKTKLPAPQGIKIYYKDIAVQAVKTKLPGNAGNKLIKNWSLKSYNINDYQLDKFYDAFSGDGKAEAISPAEIIDVTACIKDGVLIWDAPVGDWTIIRYGMTSTGKRNDYASHGYKGGLCYDPINKRGVMAQFEAIGKPMADIARKNGTSLKFFHIDSWEMGLCNWTQGFDEAFKQRRGYNIEPYLPVLAGYIVGSRDMSNRFLEDFRLTVGDLAAEENYQLLNKLADEEGISFHSESAGPHQPPVDGLRTLGATDIPMGEAWARSTTHRTSEPERMQVALGASAAHIYGKRYVAAEAPTSVGPIWERSPCQVKNVLDRIFCTGVNRLNWHTYDSSPDEFGQPGIVYFAGTHLNRNVTWWNEANAVIAYINRTQNMLIQGLHVADVLGFLGSRAPLFAVLHRLERDDVPPGYAWDMCNADAFLKRASVKNGRIVMPDGKSYALFALTDDKQMYLPLLRRIEAMVRDGMVLVGSPPQRPFGLTGYPESDVEFAATVKRIWGAADGSTPVVRPYGKGRVYSGQPVDQVLKAEKITPDLKWQPNRDIDLEYIHLTSLDDEVDVYYVINKWARHGIDDLSYRYTPTLPDRFVNVRCSFRVTGHRRIERWDPVSGKITPVLAYEQKDGYYHLPVSLEPEGGAFYVFRKAPSLRNIVSITRDGVELTEGNTPLDVGASSVFVMDGQLEVQTEGTYEVAYADGKTVKLEIPEIVDDMTIDGPWLVDFLEKPQLGEKFSATYRNLKSWTESVSRAEKYFSGTARYTRSIALTKKQIAPDNKLYIDLGYVGDIATVRINGKEARVLWKPPYVADITSFVQAGENKLEIDVTNLWVNRLIGDRQLPPEKRKTYTNLSERKGRYSLDRLGGADADKYLRVSGLIGPVRIRCSRLAGSLRHGISANEVKAASSRRTPNSAFKAPN